MNPEFENVCKTDELQKHFMISPKLEDTFSDVAKLADMPCNKKRSGAARGEQRDQQLKHSQQNQKYRNVIESQFGENSGIGDKQKLNDNKQEGKAGKGESSKHTINQGRHGWNSKAQDQQDPSSSDSLWKGNDKRGTDKTKNDNKQGGNWTKNIKQQSGKDDSSADDNNKLRAENRKQNNTDKNNGQGQKKGYGIDDNIKDGETRPNGQPRKGSANETDERLQRRHNQQNGETHGDNAKKWGEGHRLKTPSHERQVQISRGQRHYRGYGAEGGQRGREKPEKERHAQEKNNRRNKSDLEIIHGQRKASTEEKNGVKTHSNQAQGNQREGGGNSNEPNGRVKGKTGKRGQRNQEQNSESHRSRRPGYKLFGRTRKEKKQRKGRGGGQTSEGNRSTSSRGEVKRSTFWATKRSPYPSSEYLRSASSSSLEYERSSNLLRKIQSAFSGSGDRAHEKEKHTDFQKGLVNSWRKFSKKKCNTSIPSSFKAAIKGMKKGDDSCDFENINRQACCLHFEDEGTKAPSPMNTGKNIRELVSTEWAITRILMYDDSSTTYEIMEHSTTEPQNISLEVSEVFARSQPLR